MSQSTKLEWKTGKDLDGNTRHLAVSNVKFDNSYYGWNIRPVFLNDYVFYNVITSQPLTTEKDRTFGTVDDAKSWCQAREDEAWAKANPPKKKTGLAFMNGKLIEIASWDAKHRDENGLNSVDITFSTEGRSSSFPKDFFKPKFFCIFSMMVILLTRGNS